MTGIDRVGSRIVGLAIVAGLVAGAIGGLGVSLALRARRAASSALVPTPIPGSPGLAASSGSVIIRGGDSAAIKGAVQKVIPAVVHVTQRQEVETIFGVPLVQEGAGTGFIFEGKNGYILTNEHVIAGADQVFVKLTDERGHQKEFPARIVAADPYRDLAILHVAASGLPEARLGDTDPVEIGDWVVAIGGPFGFDNTATLGIVSATHRSLKIEEKQYDELIQTDAAINRGNSGGPLVDLQGEVIGVNSVITSPSGASAGVGFAISSNVARRFIQEALSAGYLGVRVIDLSRRQMAALDRMGFRGPAGHRCIVLAVDPNGPAERAGLNQYDLILSLNGRDVPDSDTFARLVDDISPGQTLTIRVHRLAEHRELTVQVRVERRH